MKRGWFFCLPGLELSLILPAEEVIQAGPNGVVQTGLLLPTAQVEIAAVDAGDAVRTTIRFLSVILPAELRGDASIAVWTFTMCEYCTEAIPA